MGSDLKAIDMDMNGLGGWVFLNCYDAITVKQ